MASSDALFVANGSHAVAHSRWGGLVWVAGRWLVFAATVVLLGGLFWWPAMALTILWGVLIPILPASFFVTPQWWRGICPLATTNQWFGTRFGTMHLRDPWLATANALGIVLLVILVPARHLVFNHNGPVLAITILAVIAAAAALGTVFDGRAGFCNAICPVLPVERFYGQHPLIHLDNFRCHPCVHCIAKGCLEVDQPKSIQYAIRPSDRSVTWLTTVYGVFAASLPGFIVGYFTLSDFDPSELELLHGIGVVYGWIAGCSLASYLATFSIVALTGMSPALSLAYLGGIAGALYYWWGAPLIVRTLQMPTIAEWPARGLVLLFIVYWLARARRQVSLHACG